MALLAGADLDADFQQHIAPILEKRCVGCHHQSEAKGGLALDSRQGMLKGGESGTLLAPGRADGHLLLEYVTGESPAMPKSGPPLTQTEVNHLRRWIEQGAHWPDGLVLQERPVADNEWWSLRPLQRPSLPIVADRNGWSRSPIDAFVLAKLEQNGLRPSPEADRRTLIRRLSFDLVGLPPSPEEVAEFLTDPRPDAYERLVDRYLGSPQYGERWARHWLDVAHYGETHGYDKDKLRLNAWPYRDYIIRAFNADKPYAAFVREQIAGDVVAPGTVDGVTALGFIAAGPWDFIGHAEVPESKTDGKIARNLDRDDMVTSTLNTFCSTTVQCARCHAHKFDPISQTDYYRLQAVFAALDRADRPFDADPSTARQRQEWVSRQHELEQSLARLDRQVHEQAGPRLAEINGLLEQAKQSNQQPGSHPAEHGYHSQIEPRDDVEKWVQVDLGQPTPIARIVLHPCYDDFNQIGAGFGFPRRLKIDIADDAAFTVNVRRVADRTAADLPNPGLSRRMFEGGGMEGRYVRITATKLSPRQNDFIFALAELEILDVSGQNRARAGKVTAKDSIEAPVRWRMTNLLDGISPQSPSVNTEQQTAQWEQERDALVANRVAPSLLQQKAEIKQQLATARTTLAALPPQSTVYAGMIYSGREPFTGTGPFGGRPRSIHVLHRGDVNQPRDPVQPGAPAFVPGREAIFPLSSEHTEQERRLMLADWIVDPHNPLTWRSIVNRVWLYHFGAGLVDSPNDFGRMGQQPTHPELLDWLASEFRDGEQSLKSLHRQIVTTATYRQSSRSHEQGLAVDAGNTLLWRGPRRKLEAEAVRDSLLSISGLLDLRMEGPSFQDFVIERPEHSPHYEYRLHDPADPRSHRRSIYRFIVRSQPQPFMTTLDCADPSMSVDKRNESTNALQALALLNNGLTLLAAERFAERLVQDCPAETPLSDKITRAWLMALGREPDADEQQIAVQIATEHGLANACRMILNLNELTFID